MTYPKSCFEEPPLLTRRIELPDERLNHYLDPFKRRENRGDSIFGLRPAGCHMPFEYCGDCNIYPCIYPLGPQTSGDDATEALQCS